MIHRRALLACAVALSLPGCGPSGPAEAAKPIVDKNGTVRLILNDPVGRTAPLDTCDVELCTALVELIEGAKESIDFAVYGMRNQSRILEALAAAKARGVKVRGIVDRDAEGKNYYSSTHKLVAVVGVKNMRDDGAVDRLEAKLADKRSYQPACQRPAGFLGPLQCLRYPLKGNSCLLAAHASREPISDAGSIMHNKFWIFDRARLWTGSTNVSDSGTGGYNANLVTVIDSVPVAAWYTDEFETMFEKGKFHSLKDPGPARMVEFPGVTLEVLFSPQDLPITRRVRKLFRGAKKRIDVAVFFLTHKGITADLIAAHQRGVEVRVILDATAAGNGYSKHELLRAVGIPVKVENWGGKLHLKSAAIDGQFVVTGSMNFTTAGENGNDENTILLTGSNHAAQYHAYFDKLWTQLGDRWLSGRPDPESSDSGTACRDEVDNDYDKHADAEDPGCGAEPPPVLALPPWREVPMIEGVCQEDAPALRSSKPAKDSPAIPGNKPVEAPANSP